jgi:hypothetical protein
MTGKLAPGSIFTVSDQERWYAEQKGETSLTEQKRLANIAARRCSCEPAKVKRRWDGLDKPTTRTVHERTCAKFKRWMEEVRP